MNELPQIENAGDILVVDDTVENLDLLRDILKMAGCKVRPVPNGRLALQAVEAQRPDLVILDISMKDMSGYEVCQRLKRREDMAFIPILFVSALDDSTAKVTAFEMGGVDFITKPFQCAEVISRVDTHLKLSRLQMETRRHRAELEEAVAQRTQELQQAKKRLAVLDQAKSDFLSLISHELRTPLSGVLGVTDVVLENAEMEDKAEWTSLYQQARHKMITLLDDALLLTQIDVDSEVCYHQHQRLKDCITEACRQAMPFCAGRNVDIDHACRSCSNAAILFGNRSLLVRAITAILETAAHFASEGTKIRIHCEPAPESVTVVVSAQGRSIPANQVADFLSTLTVTQAVVPGGDLGLRPTLADRIISASGGELAVRNTDSPGIAFSIRLTRS